MCKGYSSNSQKGGEFMKKRLIFFTIILLVLLAAWQSNGSSNKYESKTQEIPSEKNGIRFGLEQNQYLTTNLEVITAIIENTTEHEFTFGSYFIIEQNIDGIWYTVPFRKDIGFDDIGLTLKSKESNKETISLTLLEKSFSPGEYRLIKYFIDSNKPYSEENKITLAAPFEVITP
jgi:hypothetical protein